MSDITKGTWKVKTGKLNGDYSVYIDGCLVKPEENDKVAKLIAAAPELLAACKEALEDLKLYCEDCNQTGQACEECSSSDAVSKCVKAIAKATE